jgi:hypothetical protein
MICNEASNIPELLAIFISFLAIVMAYFAVRYQVLSLCQSQISDKAKDCNKNIDNATQRIIETPQNISHVVSTIITTEQLIDRIIGKRVYLFITKASLIEQLYLQLHTSIIEYIKKNTITETFKEGQVKYHIGLQLDYCKRLFEKAIQKYGNATPKEINDKIEEYKRKTKI